MGSWTPEPETRPSDESGVAGVGSRGADSGGGRRQAGGWLALIALLFLAAAAMRVHNASDFFIDYGFDATFNWEYVDELTRDWSLPAPDRYWSAARPPAFFYLAGAIARSAGPFRVEAIHAIRLASSAFGLLAIGVALWGVANQLGGSRRDGRRLALAAGLMLFVPAHIYLSAMLNEEISVASWITLALVLAVWEQTEGSRGWASWARVVGIGLAGGLAFLTKLTGCLVVAAVACSFVFDGWRRGALRPALARAAVLSLIALAVGGWFYARSFIEYGYLYPQSLDAHSIMLSMPPGERSLFDYLRLSLSALTDTRVDAPGLLHSVWGGTYVTWWFDGHRHFVPRVDPMVDRVGRWILTLGVLPTVAAIAGCLRGVGRARRSAGVADTPMLATTALMLAGYVLYTWQNPWFACIKGSYLLGLIFPYAYWASERLAAWTRGPRWLAVFVWLDLALLLLAVGAAFSFGTPLWEMTLGVHYPGLPWLPGQP